MNIVAPETCPDCGGPVAPRALAGRRHPCLGSKEHSLRMHWCPVPADVLIPTCSACGSEWMDEGAAIALSALHCTEENFASRLKATLGDMIAAKRRAA